MRGSGEVTIYDVARVLNISPSTVSRGLKDHPKIRPDTREKIKRKAAEMGYRQNKFASSLRKRRSDTIGVVVPKLNSYFMATAISGIEKVTQKFGYGLIISQSQESARQEIACISTLYHSRVDGLIISLASDTGMTDHFDMMCKRNIPVVFFDRVADCSNTVSVAIDNFKAGYEITAHLIDKGCRRIVHLGGNMLINVYADRYRGYRQALEDFGLGFEEDMLIISDLSSQSGRQAAERVMHLNKRPDGLFASNDTSAVAAICELKTLGMRVPGDIAVAGFNNEPVSQVIQPNLTTVDYPASEVGETAATLLIKKLNDNELVMDSPRILKHRLIERESSLFKNSK